MKKVLFLINSLGGGGAERVLVNLVNRLDREKYDITVQTMFGDGVNREFLASDIKYKSTNAACPQGVSFLYRFIPAQMLYKRFIGNERYDLLIAYMHGAPVKALAGCPDKKVKRIAWLHFGNPGKGSFFKFWHTNKMAFRAYNQMDAIVGVANSVVNEFALFTGIHDKLYTVYNTNDVDRILSMAQELPVLTDAGAENDGIRICTAGRLVPQKGYDRLIAVAKRLHDEGYRFSVSIMGTGSDEYRGKLESMIQSNNADAYIRLLGFQKNPYAVMKNSDLYVLSSREEGLATVLTEALFTELPIVATDVSGTREVLGEHDEYGIVVENSEDGIYRGLKRILSDPKLLKCYKGKSKGRADFFAPEKTVKQAEALMDHVLLNG